MPEQHRRSKVAALLVVAAVLCNIPSTGWSHAIVESFSLQGHPVPAQTPVVAILRFNVGVEWKFTKVFLVDADGKERALSYTPGPAPGELRVTLPPLPANAYALRYQVMAADGHLTEDILRFRVSPLQ